MTGAEVKSVRGGQVSLNGAYVSILRGEAFLRNTFIARYKNSPAQELYNEYGDRKLLLHRAQIIKLQNSLNEKGVTIVPIEIYTSKKRIKLKIAIAKGKKQHDKRESIKKKENKRSDERALRQRV